MHYHFTEKKDRELPARLFTRERSDIFCRRPPPLPSREGSVCAVGGKAGQNQQGREEENSEQIKTRQA